MRKKNYREISNEEYNISHTLKKKIKLYIKNFTNIIFSYLKMAKNKFKNWIDLDINKFLKFEKHLFKEDIQIIMREQRIFLQFYVNQYIYYKLLDRSLINTKVN